jgi:signal transduction histidine kinase
MNAGSTLTLLELLPDAYITTDVHLRIVQSNSRATSLFQFPLSVTPSSSLLDLFDSYATQKILQHLDELLCGATHVEWEMSVRANRSESHDTHVFLTCTRNLNGDIRELHWMFRSNARLCDAVRKAHEQSEEIILKREQILTLITHDLKNPVMVITGFAELLKRDFSEAGHDVWWEMIVHIEAAAARINAQVDELLDAGRLQSGKPLELEFRTSDLAVLVESTVQEVRSTTSRLIELHLELPTLTSYVDVLRTKRVIGSLLNNAVKYSPPHSTIIVHLTQEHESGQSWAVLRVQDRGIGIPVEDLPNLFQYFFRAKNAAYTTKGIGISLASARRIAQQHGGGLTVESTEGVGSTFTLRLPLPNAREHS